MPFIASRSLSQFALPLLLGVHAQAATLLDSLSVSIYSNDGAFVSTGTSREPEQSSWLALTSHSPGCGPIAIDSISAQRAAPRFNQILRLVVSRPAGGSTGCPAWKRQRVIAPLFAGTDSLSKATLRNLIEAPVESIRIRILRAGSRDSLELSVSYGDTGRVHVYGGNYAKPTCYPQCVSVCQIRPRSWGYSWFSPLTAAEGAREVRRRVDSARVVGIRRMGEGIWLPATLADLPDSFRVGGYGPSLDPLVGFLPSVDRIQRTARRIHWDSVAKGDTTGFPVLAIADGWGRPWRLVLQGGTATGDSIVGDTLRLAGATAAFEAKPEGPGCICPNTLPNPVLPEAGTRWLELRYTDRPMPAFSGASPDSGEEWFGLRRDSLFATGDGCEHQPSRFIGTLAQAISSSIALRSPLARATPRLWRSSTGWQLDLPGEPGARMDIAIHSLTGEEVLSLRGVSPGRADLGMLRSASGILVVRISGAGGSQSLRLPALR